mmetsp:Transcript_33414/g.56806  ORF Transcript_33414/g.56806 Transcript_33414/m.56806 type:complete len:254 (-) Transcript_33414:175-936(-)
MTDNILPQKRPGASEQLSIHKEASSTSTSSTSHSNYYERLLSILSKSLEQSREKIASDAPSTIRQAYGELTSLFSQNDNGDNDNDGVSSLVDLLLGKLDSVHYRFASTQNPSSSSSTTAAGRKSSPLEELLQTQQIPQILAKLEMAISNVNQQIQLEEDEERKDQSSAREAIQRAKCTSVKNGKKRRVLPAESIGYHAFQLKKKYKEDLERELGEIQKENDVLEEALKEKWQEWNEGVQEVKNAVEKMDNLGS